MKRNRQEMEKLIVSKIQELYKLYKEYNPEGDMLSMMASKDFISANNQYWKEDRDRPLDVLLNDSGLHSREH